jgi:shikimate dehydrogenase
MKPGGHFAGVLGWPLDHTLSPAIHNAAFRAVGLDWVYFAWPVAPEYLSAAIGGIRALGAMGANVTMPHKEAVLELLDDVSGDAAAIGAVNTIQRYGDQLLGHNTDVDGFKEYLTGDAGVDPAGSSALVLGAGGAARAVVRALADLRVSTISIAARDPMKASIVGAIASDLTKVERWDRAPELATTADLIVNATPLGARGEDPLPGIRFRPGQFVVDLVYVPPTTSLVRRARAAGASAANGLGMLVHQAASSFRIWTGMDPSIEAMSAAALRSLRTI